jgi:hypothetical protein
MIRLALASLLVACGGSPRVVARPHAPSFVVVAREGDELGTLARERVIRATDEDEPDAAARAAPFLERARERAVAFAFEEALAEVSAAQVILEADAATGADFDALHLALAYRALVETNLGRQDRAEAALTAAARLRPDATLDEVRFPPDVRELYERVRMTVRAERPASLAITTEPSGALVRFDGNAVGRAPVSVVGAPGQHYVRIEAPGFYPSELPIELAQDRGTPLHVVLPGASQERAARDLVAVDPAVLRSLAHANVEALRRVFDAEVMVVVREERAYVLDLDSPVLADVEVSAEAVRRAIAPPERPPDDEGDAWPAVLVLGGAAVAAGITALVLVLTIAPDPVGRVSVVE